MGAAVSVNAATDIQPISPVNIGAQVDGNRFSSLNPANKTCPVAEPYAGSHDFCRLGTGDEYRLHHGQLIVMRGGTQQYWLHALMKTNAAVVPRISLTFRRFP